METWWVPGNLDLWLAGDGSPRLLRPFGSSNPYGKVSAAVTSGEGDREEAMEFSDRLEFFNSRCSMVFSLFLALYSSLFHDFIWFIMVSYGSLIKSDLQYHFWSCFQPSTLPNGISTVTSRILNDFSGCSDLGLYLLVLNLGNEGMIQSILINDDPSNPQQPIQQPCV